MNLPYFILINLLTFAAVYVFVRYGWARVREILLRERDRYDRVLNRQLLMNVSPNLALGLAIGAVAVCGLIPFILWHDPVTPFIGVTIGLFIPGLTLRHMEQKRREELESQLLDGILTLTSGVRTSLTLVQSMELLTKNLDGPIKQEFAQLLREYQMGMDLNQAMRNTADRIGSSNYRLLFTAIEMHRLRGGDTGQSLDRIAESIREIQRLEGKLDALTAQGRSQARMIAVVAVVIVLVYYFIDPQGVTMLFTTAIGQMLLALAIGLGAIGFVWIRRIMAVDM